MSSGMPMPVSSTSSLIMLPSARARIVMVPPFGSPFSRAVL
jgi:hypothetical protein